MSELFLYKYSDTYDLIRTELNVEDVLNSMAFLRGESLFTSIYVENSIPWFLDDHLDRLGSSLKNFKIEDLSSLKKKILEQNYYPHSYLRITFFEARGDKCFWLSVSEIENPRFKKENLILKTFQRSINYKSNFKWGNYLESLNLRREFALLDNEEILFCTNDKILECSTSNIFFSDGFKLYTPKLEAGVLGGVYRKNLILKLEDRVKEKDIFISDLKNYKHAWVTSGVKGIRAVTKIDGLNFEIKTKPLNQEIFY